MNAGDAADQVIRQVDKMMKNNERAARDVRLTKVIYFDSWAHCCSFAILDPLDW